MGAAEQRLKAPAREPSAVAVGAASVGSASKHSRFRASRGFTLLEVLVALLLLSLALVALVRTTSLEARALAQLQAGTYAQWVAANAIAELRLADDPPTIGERNGSVEMAGRRWAWRMEIAETDEREILRVDVTVTAESERRLRNDGPPIASLSGFVAR